MNIDASLSGMQAQAMGTQVTANNIANSQTDEFQPSRAVYEERPDYGGVQVSAVQVTSAQGAPVQDYRPVEVNGVMEQPMGTVNSSGTDLATEMVDLMQGQRAYEANAVAARTQDEMMGNMINELV